MLRPKPPAIKPQFVLNIKEDRFGGKVTPSHNSAMPTSTEYAGQQFPSEQREEIVVDEWATEQW